jgi:Uma2 family endonuclease
MTAMPATQQMTAEEFLARPLRTDSWREELVEGELIKSHPRPLHLIVQQELNFVLCLWARAESGRGSVWLPLDVQLDVRNVFVPDVAWYREGRGPGRDDPIPSPLPDLAVEVRSPSTWVYDVGAKKSAYERRGLPELWLVDTLAEEVLVFRRAASAAARFDVALELARGDVLGSPLLPGFELSLDELFGEP